MMTDRTCETAAGLRAWARGSYPLEAAVELLIRAFDGRFAQPGQPWIVALDHNPGPDAVVGLDQWWVHASTLAESATSGPFSGGERRVLAVVASLLGVTVRDVLVAQPVTLAQMLPGLDRRHLAMVLAAVAHAGGSHEHYALAPHAIHPDVMVPTGRLAGSLYPWPEEG